MSSKAPLAVLTVLALAAAAGALLLVGGGRTVPVDDTEDTIGRSDTVDRPASATPYDELGEIARAGLDAAAERSSAAAGTALTGGSDLATNIPADRRRLVRVEIQAPLGAPPDPDLGIVAWSDQAVDEEIDWQDAASRRVFQRRGSGQEALTSIEEAETADEVRWSVTDASASRVVDVLFDADAQTGRIHLVGRYLYLAEPLEVDLAGGVEAVALSPEIGAWVVGTVRTGGARTSADEDGVHGTVSMQGGSLGRGRGRGAGFTNRRFDLDESLAFEFRGVNPNLTVTLSADVRTLAPGSSEALELVAGTKVVADVSVAVGGAIEGRAVDLAMAPLPVPLGAEHAAALGRADRDAGQREAVSDADGRFRLVGLAEGSYTVTGDLEGWRPGRADDAVEVEAGSTRTEVLVELDAGLIITGQVFLPDGQPAAGAELRLQQGGAEAQEGGAPWARRGGNRERQSAETDAQGRFEFTALTDSSARIAASLVPETDAPALAAIMEGVTPKARETAKPITLRLQPTLAIRGLVLNDIGEPVDTFEVRAAREGYRSRDGVGDGARQSFEGEDGTFSLGGLSEGSFRVSIVAPGHESPDDQTQTVALPMAGDPLTFTLPRQATLRGLVVDPSGLPVPGANVTKVQAGGGGFGGFRRDAGVETDADGAFELTGVSPGALRIEAKSERWAPAPAQTVELAAGETVEGVVLQLSLGGTIAGVVRDESGAPWSGRRVTYASGAGPMGMFASEGSTTTDAAGRFAFEHVSADKWTVTASPDEREMFEQMRGGGGQNAFLDLMAQNLSAEVTVTEGEESFVALGAEPRRPVVVVGRVTRAGEAAGGGNVTFAREGADLFANLKRGDVADDGTYRLELDRPGAYVVSVERGSNRARNQFLIDVAEVDEQRVDLSIPAGGVAGRVRKPDGEPAAGERVTVEPQSSLSFARFDPRSARTQEDGTFEILDLDPGTYTLRVGGSSGFGRGGFGGGRGSAFGRAVVSGIAVSRDGVTAGVDVRLTGGGRVLGKVLDESGDPVVGATIFVRDAAGRSIETISSTTTDATGSFTYDRVSPGTYVVSARTDSGASPDEAGVTVVESEDTKVELKVAEATTLVVTTTDEDDNPVRVELSVVDSEGRETTGLVGTAAFRNFGGSLSTSEQRVGPLPPGRYTVTATATDGRTVSKRVTVRTRSESRVQLQFEKE